MDFSAVRGELGFNAQAAQKVEVLVHRVAGVILRQGLVHQPTIEPSGAVVIVAQPRA